LRTRVFHRVARDALRLGARFKADRVNNYAFFVQPTKRTIKGCVSTVIIHAVSKKHYGFPALDSSNGMERQFKGIIKPRSLP
jgi:hypothetical protein